MPAKLGVAVIIVTVTKRQLPHALWRLEARNAARLSLVGLRQVEYALSTYAYARGSDSSRARARLRRVVAVWQMEL